MNTSSYPDPSPASSEDITTNDYSDFSDYEPCDYTPHGSRFLPALYSIIFLLGLLGNTLVLWLILKKLRLRSMTDVCLLNLAVADLLLVCSLPFLAHQAWDQWLFGEAMCRMVLGTYYISLYGGIFFVTLMSVDRYLAIVHALRTMNARTRNYGAVAAAVTWAAAFLASFPDVLYLQVWGDEVKYCLSDMMNSGSDSTHLFALFKVNVLGLLIPLATMIFCYSMIVRKLLVGGRQSSKKHTAVRLIVVVVVVFFCCWTPYNVTLFFQAFKLVYPTIDATTACEQSKAVTLTLQVTEVLAYFHSCLNPIIYVFVGEKFRRHLLKLLEQAPCKLGQAIRSHERQDNTPGSGYTQTTSV